MHFIFALSLREPEIIWEYLRLTDFLTDRFKVGSFTHFPSFRLQIFVPPQLVVELYGRNVCFFTFLKWNSFWPDPRGAGLHEAFQILSVRTSVRPYVPTYVSTLDFSFILHAQFTSDPQYFYRFQTGYWLLGGLVTSSPDPPTLPYGGAKNMFLFGGY